MLISSDMSTPILSRSSGCPLTSKVAIVTMHCHMFFGCFVFFLPARASEQGNVIGLVSVYIYNWRASEASETLSGLFN